MSGVPSGSNIPRTTKTTLHRGDNHPAVWAFQMTHNSFDDVNEGRKLVVDGDFGAATEKAATHYQRLVEITPDGIVGPTTQRRLVQSMVLRSERKEGWTPPGLAEGQTIAESNGLLGAVNWSVKGGVDLCVTQRRVVEPYTQAAVQRAFNALYQVDLLVKQLIGRQEKYLGYAYVGQRSDRSTYAWRLAALEHNWPYGADVLADGRQLSTRRATIDDIIGYRDGKPVYGWIPRGVKFTDGTPVVTYSDWAKFYAMGSHDHRHKGVVVAQAFGVPRDG